MKANESGVLPFSHGPMGDLPLLRHLSHHKVLLGCGRRHLRTLRTSLEHSLEQIIQGKLLNYSKRKDSVTYLIPQNIFLRDPSLKSNPQNSKQLEQ
jgi:hypothetical protein